MKGSCVTSRTINTLVEDVNALFDPEIDHEPNEDFLNEFTENLKQLLRTRLRSSPRRSGGGIRFSSLGKPDRQIYFDHHPDLSSEEPLLPKTYLKFLYGDVIEQRLS